MPFINPEEAIKSSVKHSSKRKKRSHPNPKPPVQPEREPIVVKEEEPVVKPQEIKDADVVQVITRKPGDQNYHLEEVHLVRKSSSHSDDVSRGGDSISSGSVYIVEDIRKGNGKDDPDRKDSQESGNKTEGNDNDTAVLVMGDGDEDGKRKKLTRLVGKKKGLDDDRRKTTWIPCTCPQYKVSNELATKKKVQGVFFAKVMLVKIIQLAIINIVVFSVGFRRESTSTFFHRSHDWAYLAYCLFICLLFAFRVAIAYRARWPKWIAIVLTIPLTAIIAYTSACITAVYSSLLIPLVTATVLLTTALLCFTPYLLKRLVMDKSTNFAAATLSLLSSIILIFLKEFESKPMTYGEFVTHVWLPGVFIAQAVIQICVFEIQRVLFGLCFNVSSTRWHMAALYV